MNNLKTSKKDRMETAIIKSINTSKKMKTNNSKKKKIRTCMPARLNKSRKLSTMLNLIYFPFISIRREYKDIISRMVSLSSHRKPLIPTLNRFFVHSGNKLRIVTRMNMVQATFIG